MISESSILTHIVGITSGVLSSFLVIFIYTLIYPKIRFSTQIAEREDSYAIKIKNTSWRSIVGIHARCYLIKGRKLPPGEKVKKSRTIFLIICRNFCRIKKFVFKEINHPPNEKSINNSNDTIDEFTNIDLKINYVFAIQKSGTPGEYDTWRFVIPKQGQRILSDKKYDYLRFEVYAKDSFTGIGKHFVQKYFIHDSGVIVNGDYVSGDGFEIA